MSSKERSRLGVMSRIRDGEMTVAKGARLLGLSVRQCWRVRKRFEASGDCGLVHGLRGKHGNRAMEGSVREAVLQLYREKYADFGPTLACEQLAARDGHKVGVKTLWRWLVAEGLWTRQRRRKAHRARRERRACLGEMVQMDGSHHDWLEGRGPWCVLMVMIDDATGRTFARFFEGETTAAAMEVFGAYVGKWGLPHSLYVDRDSIYRSDRQGTVEEQLRSQDPTTQFGRAMEELGGAADPGELAAGEGPGRADERHASGPAGEGDASGQRQHDHGGQRVFKQDVPDEAEPPVRGDGKEPGGRASQGARGDEAAGDFMLPGDASGEQRLVRELAEADLPTGQSP